MADLTDHRRKLAQLGHDQRHLLLVQLVEAELSYLAYRHDRAIEHGDRGADEVVHFDHHRQALWRLKAQCHATMTNVGRLLGDVQPDPERRKRRGST